MKRKAGLSNLGSSNDNDSIQASSKRGMEDREGSLITQVPISLVITRGMPQASSSGKGQPFQGCNYQSRCALGQQGAEMKQFLLLALLFACAAPGRAAAGWTHGSAPSLCLPLCLSHVPGAPGISQPGFSIPLPIALGGGGCPGLM